MTKCEGPTGPNNGGFFRGCQVICDNICNTPAAKSATEPNATYTENDLSATECRYACRAGCDVDDYPIGPYYCKAYCPELCNHIATALDATDVTEDPVKLPEPSECFMKCLRMCRDEYGLGDCSKFCITHCGWGVETRSAPVYGAAGHKSEYKRYGAGGDDYKRKRYGGEQYKFNGYRPDDYYSQFNGYGVGGGRYLYKGYTADNYKSKGSKGYGYNYQHRTGCDYSKYKGYGAGSCNYPCKSYS